MLINVENGKPWDLSYADGQPHWIEHDKMAVEISGDYQMLAIAVISAADQTLKERRAFNSLEIGERAIASVKKESPAVLDSISGHWNKNMNDGKEDPTALARVTGLILMALMQDDESEEVGKWCVESFMRDGDEFAGKRYLPYPECKNES